MYEGRTDLDPGMVLGHENLGERGRGRRAVVKDQVGDRVCLPFNIGCGFCRNCEEGLTGFCLTVNPDRAWPAPPTASPRWGRSRAARPSTARALRRLQLSAPPRGRQEKEDDYVMLSDIFPTGWHSTGLAGMQPGDSVVDLRRRPGRADGRVLGDDPGRQQGDGGRPPPRPAGLAERSARSLSTTPRASPSSRCSSRPAATARDGLRMRRLPGPRPAGT